MTNSGSVILIYVPPLAGAMHSDRPPFGYRSEIPSPTKYAVALVMMRRFDPDSLRNLSATLMVD